MINKILLELIRSEVSEKPTLIEVSAAILAVKDNYPQFKNLIYRPDLSIPDYVAELTNPGTRFAKSEALWDFYIELNQFETAKEKVDYILRRSEIKEFPIEFNYYDKVILDFKSDCIVKSTETDVWDDEDEEYKVKHRTRKVSYEDYAEKLIERIFGGLTVIDDNCYDLTIDKYCNESIVRVFAWNFY